MGQLPPWLPTLSPVRKIDREESGLDFALLPDSNLSRPAYRASDCPRLTLLPPFCLGFLICWPICLSVNPRQIIGIDAGGKCRVGAPGVDGVVRQHFQSDDRFHISARSLPILPGRHAHSWHGDGRRSPVAGNRLSSGSSGIGDDGTRERKVS